MSSDGTVLLAIDTSTDFATIALFDGVVCSELAWPATRDQTVSVLAEVNHLLELTKRTTGDLGAVAVATGPGMFSGLRVGLSLAKGLVLGLQIPLIGISTLEATAWPYATCASEIVAVVAAGRGRLVWALYAASAAPLRQLVSPRNGTLSELRAELSERSGPVIITGELTPEQEAAVAELARVQLPPRPLRPRRASAVASLAWQRWRRGETDDAARLEPVYLHAAGQLK